MFDMYCSICRSNNISLIETNIYRCNNCDTVSSTIDGDSKKIIYEDIKSTPISISRKLKTKLSARMAHLIAKEYFNYVQGHLDVSKIKNALDIGTSYGHFVKILNECGIDAYGIEADRYTLSQKITNKISYGWFDENYDDNKKYDLISLTQMIYYMPDNLKIFEKVSSMLNPNGYVFVATTNPDTKSIFRDKIIGSLNYKHIKIFLSKKAYGLIPNFKLIDYTTYWANIFDAYYHDKKKLAMILLGMEKAYHKDPDGFQSFIILQKQ